VRQVKRVQRALCRRRRQLCARLALQEAVRQPGSAAAAAGGGGGGGKLRLS
jgi:hypothetical protein